MDTLPSSAPIPLAGFTPGPLKKLFADRRDAQFWQTEGMQHSYLFWVRAMMTEELEPPPFPAPSSPFMTLCSAPRQGQKLEDARSRRIAYGFLARAWSYPTRELHANFSSRLYVTSLAQAWEHLAGDATEFERAAAQPPAQFEELCKEYTRLFYDTYLPFIPPYESVYSNERQVMGKRAAAIIDSYRRAGLVAEGELPDHIAHECEFIAHLAGEEELARSSRDPGADRLCALQIDFLRDHLLPWGMKFCADLACLARGNFYAATARLASALFNAEWSTISENERFAARSEEPCQ